LIFTYDGRDGELLLLGVLEELQSERLAKVLSSFLTCKAAYGLDVLAVDDTGLLENFLGRHFG